jgi:hypothetical protein
MPPEPLLIPLLILCVLLSSTAVEESVAEILAHARSDGAKADEIICGIMRHPKLRDHLSSFSEDTNESRRLQQLKDDILDELEESIKVLKTGARNTPEWFAYRCLLNAIVPADYQHSQLMANFTGSHFNTIKVGYCSACPVRVISIHSRLSHRQHLLEKKR